MQYLVIEKINNSYYLVGNTPFDTEKQAHMMLDLQRECNPHRNIKLCLF